MSWDWWLFSAHIISLTVRLTLVSETSSELGGEGGHIPPAASVMNGESSITSLRWMDVLQRRGSISRNKVLEEKRRKVLRLHKAVIQTRPKSSPKQLGKAQASLKSGVILANDFATRQ